MVNRHHFNILQQGVTEWNKWRQANPDTQPDLNAANLHSQWLKDIDLHQADLRGIYLFQAILIDADLRAANLCGATLSCADLTNAHLDHANLFRANLRGATLSETNLCEADLHDADLRRADLYWANFSGANLSGANLSYADIVDTNLNGAKLTSCSVYGISVWNVQLEGAAQSNLIITPPDESTITVDNLEVAQFIYLLLNNKKIHDVIDTVTSKVVLILGRFTSERKAVLDALRDELRKRNYSPVLFDFEKPASRDLTETISTLAHMARFVIADITDAKSIPQELSYIVPFLPSVPVQPLLQEPDYEYGMFEHLTRFPWVLPLYRYTDQASLLQSLKENVIDPAEKKAQELAKQ